jgi:hypothetical protein
MKATVANILDSLNEIKSRLLAADLLEDWNESVAEQVERGITRVTWATSGTRPELSGIINSNVKEYLLFLQGRHYQFRLTDGSLIQMSYDIRHQSEVKQSRLVWYPCPVEFSREEIQDFDLEELILSSPTEMLCLQAPIRIDYAPHQKRDNHSTTHLHLGREEFRLPVQRPLEPSRFLRLIIRTAYPHVWSSEDNFRTVEDWRGADGLDDDDKIYGSLSWNLPLNNPK